MDSTLQWYGFDVEIIIISISNLYSNDITTALSFWYEFDIVTIWIRCRIYTEMIMLSWYCYHMDLTSYRYCNNIKSTSLQHHNNVIILICIWYQNNNDFDIKSISLQCQIHIEMITLLWYHNDIDMMSMPVLNPYHNNLVLM